MQCSAAIEAAIKIFDQDFDRAVADLPTVYKRVTPLR